MLIFLNTNLEQKLMNITMKTNSNYEKSRQLMIESHGITIIRTNPDAADFDMNKLINQIYKHISQSSKEKLEKEKEVEIKKLKSKTKEQANKIKEQKNDFAKELLSYVSSISMPVKHIKYFVKKILLTL